MRAGALKEPIAALLIAEQHEAFAEQSHRLDRAIAGKLIDERDWLPVAPHQRSSRRSAADAGDEVVLLGAQHGRLSCSLLPQLYDC